MYSSESGYRTPPQGPTLVCTRAVTAPQGAMIDSEIKQAAAECRWLRTVVRHGLANTAIRAIDVENQAKPDLGLLHLPQEKLTA